MFDVGNKIVVTGSSIKKGKPGPVVNSIGYIKQVNGVFIKLNNYFVTSSEIIFCRFGRGKKYRTETKTILILFPNEIKNTTDFSFTKQQFFLRRLNPQTSKDLKKIIGMKNISTVSPIHTNTLEKDITYNERMSYLLSLWTFKNLNSDIRIIQETNWYNKYKVKNISNIIAVLSKGLGDTTYRHDMVYRLSSDINEYKKFIMVMKLITLRSKSHNYVTAVMDKNGLDITEEDSKFVYKTLYLNLFNNYYNTLAKTFINNQQDDKKKQIIKTIITNLDCARQRLITNGQKYI